MTGLKIKTTNGKEFEVYGDVLYRPEYDVYYCADQSFPAMIVEKVLYE